MNDQEVKLRMNDLDVKSGSAWFCCYTFSKVFSSSVQTAKVKDSQEITVKAIPKVIQHAPPASLDWFL